MRPKYRSSSKSEEREMASEPSVLSDSEPSRRSRSRSRSRSDERDGYRLHIADIAEGVKQSQLESVFKEFGSLKEVWMANSPPCFGFAVFGRKSSAVRALKEADGMNLGGSRIRVSNARPRTRGFGRRYYNPNMRCYQCGMSGHFYRDCPEHYEEYHESRSDRHSRKYSSRSGGRGGGEYERGDRRRRYEYSPEGGERRHQRRHRERY